MLSPPGTLIIHHSLIDVQLRPPALLRNYLGIDQLPIIGVATLPPSGEYNDNSWIQEDSCLKIYINVYTCGEEKCIEVLEL